MKAQCVECGLDYRTVSQAEYCATADRDPQKENGLLRSGLMYWEWIPRPVVERPEPFRFRQGVGPVQ